MDPLTFVAVFQLVVTLGAVTVLGWVVDARARRRDAATRAMIAGMEQRVTSAVTARVIDAVKVMLGERATPVSLPPPTLQ